MWRSAENPATQQTLKFPTNTDNGTQNQFWSGKRLTKFNLETINLKMRPSQNGSSFLFAANINPATFRCCFIKRQAQNFQSPQTWASLDLTFRFGAVSHLASLWGFAFKSSCQSLSPKLRNPSCAILTLRAGDLDSGQHLNGLFINLVPSKEKRHLKKS